MTPKALDYRHRPGKNIERHLIVDMARRLLATTSSDFQYVGFGAIEFLDFQLVHRALGIERMISIERENVARAEFNKPFRSIKIIHGDSTDVFRRREIDLGRPTIIWLDYMGQLDKNVMADLTEVGRSIAAPSFVVISINARPGREDTRLAEFKRNVGERLRPGTDTDTLAGRGLALEQQQIFSEVIGDSLASRKEDLAWYQTLNIHYRDGALMQTIAGFVLPATQTSLDVTVLAKGLDFFRPGEEFLDLRVPVITPKERADLDRQLPKKSRMPLRHAVVPRTEVIAYRDIYKYLHLAGLQSATETTWTE